jgi:hypothetical protein
VNRWRDDLFFGLRVFVLLRNFCYECCMLGSAEGRAGDAGEFLTHLMLFPAT